VNITEGVAENVLCFPMGLERRGARFRYWVWLLSRILKSNEQDSSLCIEVFCDIK